MIYKFNQSCCL